MRTIDADATKIEITNYLSQCIDKGKINVDVTELQINLFKIINKQPTAYNVEKVVAELEEELELAEKEEKRCLMEHSQRYERAEQYALGISNALDIVRNGGKE